MVFLILVTVWVVFVAASWFTAGYTYAMRQCTRHLEGIARDVGPTVPRHWEDTPRVGRIPRWRDDEEGDW